MSGRVQGPRYATIASVSSAACESPRSAGRVPCSLLLFDAPDENPCERSSLVDDDLPRLPQLQHGEERGCLLEPCQSFELLLEVESAASPERGPEALEEPRDGREVELHV